MLVEQAAAARDGHAAPPDRPQPLRRCHVAARRHAAGRPGQGVRHHHRRVQRVLQLLRRAVHARPRADAAEGRHPGRGPRGGATGAAGSPAARPDREPLRGAGRARRATSRRCSKRSTRSPGIERIRFASPHPRHVTPRFLDAMARLPKVCRHLHLPVQSGSTRVLEAMRRRYTRDELPRSRRAHPRRRCRTWRCRPI